MNVSLVASVVFKKNKFGIGTDGELLYKIPKDMKFFKTLTTGHTVIMGYKTWMSIPEKNRPLKNRKNIILTKTHLTCKSDDNVNFTTFAYIKRKILNSNPSEKFFIIGGAQIYNLFLNDDLISPQKLIINHISPDITKEVDTHLEPDVLSKYEITGYSEKMFSDNLSYRYLFYKKSIDRHPENVYIDLLKDILKNGKDREDRTNVGTLSSFGKTMRFDISNNIPMMTTKRLPFKTIVEELLWFCRGDTDAKILQKKGIKIWDGNTSRSFLDSRGLSHYPKGVLGPQYGFLWRHFGADYSTSYADTSKCDTSAIGGFDQLKYIEDLLENDPFSRRILISAWSPDKLNEQCLPSCHHTIQFYVTKEGDQKYLSCMFIMRSSDSLAWAYNCVGYSILTHILAKKHNMKPKNLIYIAGDTHIYKNHLDAVNEQIKRCPRPFPTLAIDDSIAKKDWKDLTVEDFELIGYFPHNSIKVEMAI